MTWEIAVHRIKKTVSLHKGLILVLLACVCHAINSVIVKTLGGRIPSMQIVFWRQLSVFLFSSTLIVLYDVSLKISVRELGIIIAYIVLVAITYWMTFYSLEHIPAGDMSAILASSPIFTGVLAWLLLRRGSRYWMPSYLYWQSSGLYSLHGHHFSSDLLTRTLDVAETPP